MLRISIIVIFILAMASSLFSALTEDELEGNWLARIKDDKIRMSFMIFDEEYSESDWRVTVLLKKNELENLQ